MSDYTYDEFLADVREEQVFVGGLGVGSIEGAWITVSGRSTQPGSIGAQHLRQALETGRFEIENGRLRLRNNGGTAP